MRDAVVSKLAQAVVRGERVALSKAITLVESVRQGSRASASALLTSVLPHRDASRTMRIGAPPASPRGCLS